MHKFEEGRIYLWISRAPTFDVYLIAADYGHGNTVEADDGWAYEGVVGPLTYDQYIAVAALIQRRIDISDEITRLVLDGDHIADELLEIQRQLQEEAQDV